MNDTKELLQRARNQFPPPEGVMESLRRRRDRKRRNQRIAAGVVGIAVFVAAVLIVGTVGLSDRTQGPAGGAETGPAETGPTETGPTETGPAEAIGPVPATDYLLDLDTGETMPLPESIVGGEDVTGAYAVSPDGSRLAYVERGDNGGVGILVANLDGTGIEQLTVEAVPDGFGAAPAWSPDGSRIAYVGRDSNVLNVYVLDLAEGVSTQGSFTLYNVWRGGVGEVRIVPVAGGESERWVGGDGNVGEPQLSPDGSLLSYSCGGRWPYDLCLANADGTDARLLLEGVQPPGKWSSDGKWIAFWRFSSGVYVMEVATGEVTAVGEGAFPIWLEGHTLIVETDRCNLPRDNCGF